MLSLFYNFEDLYPTDREPHYKSQDNIILRYSSYYLLLVKNYLAGHYVHDHYEHIFPLNHCNVFLLSAPVPHCKGNRVKKKYFCMYTKFANILENPTFPISDFQDHQSFIHKIFVLKLKTRANDDQFSCETNCNKLDARELIC